MLLGSEKRPLRVAIIGAGPSGFYAAGGLLQQSEYSVTVDMFDRLPAPYGLVRYGVAPDHQKIKSVTRIFDRTASSPRFRFFGNIDFGTDITHADLKQHYDHIIYAVGAQSDRKLGIPGEDLRNSLSATEFVAWYNGHPFFSDLDFDLDCETAIVVGVGNVAMDVARILARSIAELKVTDIADHALERLERSRVRDIYVLSRRGPAQAKFTNPEIRELGELEDADVIVRADELELDPASEKEIAEDPRAARNLDILREFAARQPSGKPKRLHLRFLVSPVELIADDDGSVASVRIERNKLEPNDSGYLNAIGLGEFETLPSCLALRSVGYKGIALEDVPYDERRGTIPNREGRVIDPASGKRLPGEYVVGWAKRGPSGVIGTNKPDALETVRLMLEDIAATPPAPQPDPASIDAILEQRELQSISIDAWRILDRIEVAEGEKQGRPRVKFTHVHEMLEALEQALKMPVAD